MWGTCHPSKERVWQGKQVDDCLLNDTTRMLILGTNPQEFLIQPFLSLG
jgi:hypothetical protein